MAVRWQTQLPARVVALAAATGLMLPGCAVLNPHVDAPRLDGVYAQPSDCAQNNPPPQACTRFHGRLVEAVGAADQLRRNYLGAVNQYAYARSGLALTIIPLTAWGVYRGVTSSGGATDALAATAIGAAGGYAVGNQLLVGRSNSFTWREPRRSVAQFSRCAPIWWTQATRRPISSNP